MKQVSVIHLGIGNVGKEVMKQITEQQFMIRKTFGIELIYNHTFTSKNSVKEIHQAIQTVSLPCILIDTTASDATIPYIKSILKRGGYVVTANKKPLSGNWKDFDSLQKTGESRLFFETTVGAGLPVIHTLKNLLMTGDEIKEIQGCLSGTLGYIFSQLDQKKIFSYTVLDAKQKGFTEPDPRDDLSGRDVARKALILARLLGQKIELEDIQLTSLYPQIMQKLSVDDFLQQTATLDDFYKEKVTKAKKEHKVLRFVAKITPQTCSVGLQAIPASGNIGNVTGSDNSIVFKTERYFHNPLVIKGPGAGIPVTAAGVFGDILLILNKFSF